MSSIVSKVLLKSPVGEEFLLEIEKESISLVFLAEDLKFLKSNLIFLKIRIFDYPQTLSRGGLSEVVVSAKKGSFQLSRLRILKNRNIWEKTEVILVEQSMANLASNNARQIFSQIPGLNIYQNDDAGLQLHIGGRG